MTPSCSSSAPIWREIADWLSFSDSPACVKLPASATAWNIRSLSQSISFPPLSTPADYSAASAWRASCPASHFSASSAAMQPVPAAVTACRKTLSCTSPAA